jgi:hypothetical protein
MKNEIHNKSNSNSNKKRSTSEKWWIYSNYFKAL